METNQTTRSLYEDGKPFSLFRVNFVPTMLDEFYTPELDNPGEFYDGINWRLRVYAVDETYAYYYNVIDTANRAEVTNTYLADGTAIASKMDWTIPDLSAVSMTRITLATGVAAADGVPGAGPVFAQLPVHKGILYGKEALVKIGIAGEGNAKTFVQALGSAGTNDPLHQRQTIGAKINSIGYGLLRDEAVTVTFSVPSQALYTAGLTASAISMALGVEGLDADGAEPAADVVTAFIAEREYTVDPKDITKGTVIND